MRTRILEVTLGKSAILPRFITLCCVSIAKSFAENTEKLLQGTIRGGAPRAPGAAARCPPRLRCAALRQDEQTFHVPSRRLRFEGTFHVFAFARQKHFTFARLAYLICLFMMTIMPNRRL